MCLRGPSASSCKKWDSLNISQADLLRIARAIHPNGDTASWALLAGCAIALPREVASAIAEAFIRATAIAEQDGRDCVTFEDSETMIRFDFQPLEAAPARSTNEISAFALNGCCRRFAKGGDKSCSTASARKPKPAARDRQYVSCLKLPPMQTASPDIVFACTKLLDLVCGRCSRFTEQSYFVQEAGYLVPIRNG